MSLSESSSFRQEKSSITTWAGVAVVAVIGCAEFAIKSLVDKSLSQPCSVEQSASLKQVDRFILSHRQQIAAWYTKLCTQPMSQCRELPRRVFDFSTPVEYHCFSDKQQSSNKNLCRGVARPHTFSDSSVTLSPGVFDDSKRDGDLCFLANVAFHERVHLATGEDHTRASQRGEVLDSAYAAGNAVELACIDTFHGSTSASDAERYEAALKIFYQRGVVHPRTPTDILKSPTR